MDKPETFLYHLDRFKRLKMREIPTELDEYLRFVAQTGDTVFNWQTVRHFYREKYLQVLKNFDGGVVQEIPNYPNVDPFNFDNMKNVLLTRLDSFNAAPFTIQRLSDLLLEPRRQYSRIDKYMRALEKTILVVSTVQPGCSRRLQYENGDAETLANGELSTDMNIDVECLHENTSFNSREVSNGQTATDSNAAHDDDSEEPLHKRFKADYESADEPMETENQGYAESEIPTVAEVNAAEIQAPVAASVEPPVQAADTSTTTAEETPANETVVAESVEDATSQAKACLAAAVAATVEPQPTDVVEAMVEPIQELEESTQIADTTAIVIAELAAEETAEVGTRTVSVEPPTEALAVNEESEAESKSETTAEETNTT